MDSRATLELTDEQYWSDLWQSLPDEGSPIDPESDQHRGYHQFFSDELRGRSGNLLEVGCGSSRWLPYFVREFGFEVSGIDYSETGCRQASAILQRAGMRGRILQRDAMAENEDLLEQFDVVVSLGLVEHFADTVSILRSLARYVRPGGLLVSTAPNMAGLLGTAQRILNRSVYEGHVPFTLEELSDAHRTAGLKVNNASQIGSLDFHVLNLHGATERWKWLVYKVLIRMTRIGWKAPLSLPRTQLWSSGMGVCAVKA